MKAFNDSLEKQFTGLASSFPLTEKSVVETAHTGNCRLCALNDHDERSQTGILTWGFASLPTFPVPLMRR
jgi:hypothetical protein